MIVLPDGGSYYDILAYFNDMLSFYIDCHNMFETVYFRSATLSIII